jgi:predicted metal-dependent hydrolase
MVINGEQQPMHLDPEEIERLRQGVYHFRIGDYFAAHDDWEEVWQGLRGRRRTFWQAMIQLVVGAYHLQHGNRKGCTSLWHKALQKCDDLTRTYEVEVPEPLSLLSHLLHDCLTSLHHGADPWGHIAHFANEVLSEEWFAVH